MDSSTSNWKEGRKCRFCDQSLTYNVGMPALFAHVLSNPHCPSRYPEATPLDETISSNTWSWKEALKDLKIHCQSCKREIVPVELEFIEGDRGRNICSWAHTSPTGDVHHIEPIYHELPGHEISLLGFLNGMNGALILDNPFCPNGPFYDGANSMGEAATWHRGWYEAQIKLGRIPSEPPIPPLDSLDFLEEQRG